MIITRAPLRVSLARGGTDLPSYADRFGGLVVSTTIDRYVYVIVTRMPDGMLQITAYGDRLPIETLQHSGITRAAVSSSRRRSRRASDRARPAPRPWR